MGTTFYGVSDIEELPNNLQSNEILKISETNSATYTMGGDIRLVEFGFDESEIASAEREGLDLIVYLENGNVIRFNDYFNHHPEVPTEHVPFDFPEESAVILALPSSSVPSYLSPAAIGVLALGVLALAARGGSDDNAAADNDGGEPPVTPALTIDIGTIVSQNDGTVTVTGSTEPNATVTVTFPDTDDPSGTVTATVMADEDGNYEATSPTEVDPEGTIEAQASVGDQTSAPATGNYGPTDPAPTDLEVDITSAEQSPDGTVTALGTTDPNATVTVSFPESDDPSGTVTVTVIADGDGNFTAASPAGMNPGGIVAAQAEDGETTSPIDVEPYQDGIPAPVAPLEVDITSAEQSPDGSVEALGTTAPNATVTVAFPDMDDPSGTVTVTTVADGNGDWVATSPAGMDQGGEIEAIAEDGTQTSDPAQEPYDNGVLPTVDISTAIQEPDGSITVVGQTEPNNTVTVTFPDEDSSGGVQVVVVADASGNFLAVSPVGMDEGGTVEAVANDGNLDSLPDTEPYDDGVPPEVDLTSADQEQDGTVTAVGTTEPNATVTVTFPDVDDPMQTVTVTVVADQNGDFTAVSPPGMNEGGTVVAVANDGMQDSAPDAEPYDDGVSPTVDITSAMQDVTGAVTAVGTTEPDNTVTVTFPDDGDPSGTVTVIVLADGNGDFTAVSPPGMNEGGQVGAVAFDGLLVSTPDIEGYADGVPPFGPFVSLETAEQDQDGSVTVTGSSDPGNTVTVTFPDDDAPGGTVTVTVVADINGDYTAVSLPGMNEGGDVEAVAANGIETTNPVPGSYDDGVSPTVDILTVTQDVDGSVTAFGTTEPNNTVTVTFPDADTTGGEIQVVVVADGSGNFTAVSPAGMDEGGTVEAIANDGNLDSTVDTQPYADGVPLPIEITSVNQTPDGAVTAEGETEPNATVTVTFPDQDDPSGTVTVTTVADANGNWTAVSPPGMDDGGNVTAQATDGISTSPVDTEPYIDGVTPTVDITSAIQSADGSVTAAGTTEPGNTVTVTFPDADTTGGEIQVVVVADTNGDWTITSPAGMDEGGTVEAIANDGTLDSSADTEPYDDGVPPEVTIDTTTPNNDGSVTVVGETEPGATVTVTFPDADDPSNTVTVTVVADTNGDYTATSPNDVDLTGSVTAIANDGTNNSSIVMDTYSPAVAAPTINQSVTDQANTVSGTGVVGAVVTVEDSGGATVGSATVKPDGTWSLVAASAIPDGETLSATQEESGNTSPVVTQATFTDTDGDGIANTTDTDDDGDNSASSGGGGGTAPDGSGGATNAIGFTGPTMGANIIRLGNFDQINRDAIEGRGDPGVLVPGDGSPSQNITLDFGSSDDDAESARSVLGGMTFSNSATGMEIVRVNPTSTYNSDWSNPGYNPGLDPNVNDGIQGRNGDVYYTTSSFGWISGSAASSDYRTSGAFGEIFALDLDGDGVLEYHSLDGITFVRSATITYTDGTSTSLSATRALTIVQTASGDVFITNYDGGTIDSTKTIASITTGTSFDQSGNQSAFIGSGPAGPFADVTVDIAAPAGLADSGEDANSLDGDATIADSLDIDSDNDGIWDRFEGAADDDSNGDANYRDIDSDGDGTNDREEAAADFNATSASSTGYIILDPAGATTLDFSTVAANVTDLEYIDMQDGDIDSTAGTAQELTVTAADLFGTGGSAAGNSLYIVGDGADTVNLTGFTATDNQVSQEGQIFDVYITANNDELYVHSDIGTVNI